MNAYKSIITVLAGFILFTSANAQNHKENQILITHSQSSIIEPETSIACNNNGITYENSYYRNFDLYNDFLVNDEWIVQNIVFGAALAQTSGGSQPVILKFYTMPESSALVTDSMTLIHTQYEIYFDSDSEQLVNYPVTGLVSVPKKRNLVVEILIPDGQNDQNYFFLASNNLGQTDASYIRAPFCGIQTPVSFNSISYPDMQLILQVLGQYASPHPEIFSFNVDGQITSTIITNEPEYTINLTMPYDASLTALQAQISIPAGFQIFPANGETVDFSQGPVEYTVTNEASKVSQTWDVNINNSDADILAFQIEGQSSPTIISGQPDYTVSLFMPDDTTINALAPYVEVHDDFYTEPASTEIQDFSQGPVTYTVKHNNSDYEREWTVFVNQEGSSVSDLPYHKLSIHPNPAKNEVHISFSESLKGDVNLQIFNICGSVVLQKQFGKLNKQTIRINLSDFAPGIYPIKIQNENKIFTGKIIKLL